MPVLTSSGSHSVSVLRPPISMGSSGSSSGSRISGLGSVLSSSYSSSKYSPSSSSLTLPTNYRSRSSYDLMKLSSSPTSSTHITSSSYPFPSSSSPTSSISSSRSSSSSSTTGSTGGVHSSSSGYNSRKSCLKHQLLTSNARHFLTHVLIAFLCERFVSIMFTSQKKDMHATVVWVRESFILRISL